MNNAPAFPLSREKKLTIDHDGLRRAESSRDVDSAHAESTRKASCFTNSAKMPSTVHKESYKA